MFKRGAIMDAGNKPPLPRFSLQRWSQRKLEAAREEAPPSTSDASASVPADAEPTPAPAAIEKEPPNAQQAPELPPVETLTFESDFTAFLQPRVEEAVKRQALKKLFRDARFNVMDGLDTYIDDYSIPSPVSAELLREMVHARVTLDPPKTCINAAGYVEDVPPEKLEAETPAEQDVARASEEAAVGIHSACESTSTGEAPATVSPEDELRASSRTSIPGSQTLDASGTASPPQRIESPSNGTAAPAAQPQRHDHR